MKLIKKILIALVVLILIGCASGYFYLQSYNPDYNENIKLTGLSEEVELFYDQYAIPHIYAKNEKDAFRTLGYLQAKERLWQMELVRRIAPGRLSEVFGEATVETDKLFKMMGISEYSESSLDYFNNKMEQPIRENVLAYLDGINQYIDNGKTPIEYTVIGLEKTHFTPVDVYNAIGYMAFSFGLAHKTEPVLTYILEKYGVDYLKDLNVHPDSSKTTIKTGIDFSALEALSINVDHIMSGLPAPAFIGSNSWVISGDKTKSGEVVFANDPHIGFSQPSVWYEAHIHTPSLETYGYCLAGFPFPHLMHNNNHAIGLTMFENDDVDFYKEKQNPRNADQYEYKGEWLNYKYRNEIIKVKDGGDIQLKIKTTVHGPVMNDAFAAISSVEPVSMWWSYLKNENRTIDASYKLNVAKNMTEVRYAASLIHGPGLNVMYGDKEGNVAWWACAKLIKRPEHVNSKLILDGSSGNDDPLGYYDFSENPKAENPEWGYVYSANNQPYTEGQPLYPGYYLPEDRARRIVGLLEEKNNWTAEEAKKMITDVTSDNAPEIVATLLSTLDRTELSNIELTAISLLEGWEGEHFIESTAPVIYNKLMYHIIYDAMADELGNELFKVYNGTHLMKRSTQPLVANNNSKWWDDINTENNKETRSEIINTAFKKTITELQKQLGNDMKKWQWGDVHTLEHNHSFSAVPSLKKYFNVGPFHMSGNTETINNLQYRLEPDGTYEVKAGPSTRRIVDFANVAGNSWSILPTGQSGNVMSAHYKDQAEMYAKGKFRRQLLDKEEIKKTAKYKTVIGN